MRLVCNISMLPSVVVCSTSSSLTWEVLTTCIRTLFNTSNSFSTELLLRHQSLTTLMKESIFWSTKLQEFCTLISQEVYSKEISSSIRCLSPPVSKSKPMKLTWVFGMRSLEVLQSWVLKNQLLNLRGQNKSKNFSGIPFTPEKSGLLARLMVLPST